MSSDEEFQDDEIIDSIIQADLYSIYDDSDADDLDFCRCTNKKLALGDKDKMPLSVLKHNIGKLKIDSDSEREYEEEEHLQFQKLSTLNFPKKQKLSCAKGCILFMILTTLDGTITNYQRERLTNSQKWKST